MAFARPRVPSVLCTLALLVASGCAVLTQSQVEEVRRYAEATSEYTSLPGAVVVAYGELRRELILLDASHRKLDQRTADGKLDPTAAGELVERLDAAYVQEASFDDDGRRIDAQLDVLREYAEVLERVVSDEYTSALGDSAARSAAALDTATAGLNARRAGKAPIPLVGGRIAATIRGTYGIYIRHRQSKILRDTVESATPLVSGLMDDVVEINERMVENFENQISNGFAGPVKSLGMRMGELDLDQLRLVYEDLRLARKGQDLARKVSETAKAYKAAHLELVSKTRAKADLTEVIAQMETLRGEIDAAQKLKADAQK